MDAQGIANALANRNKGCFFTVYINRPAELRGGVGNVNIRKASRVQGMLADYANRAPVKEAVAEGERDAPKLPKWVANVFHIGNVKFWRGNCGPNGEPGQEYLPVCVVGNNTTSEWLLNGAVVDESEIAPYLAGKELTKPRSKQTAEESGQAIFIAIKLQNVVEIR